MNGNTFLGQEWQTLQDNHERYEASALLIKLASLALAVAGLASGLALAWIGLVVVLCWGQEGILKTYQARLGERLLRIEALLRQPEPPTLAAMQLHSEWAAQRPGVIGLLAGYAASACRPTVAFPYAPLLIAGALAKVFSWA